MGVSRRRAVFTFVLTDIEESTRLLVEHGQRMEEAVATHDSILAEEIQRAGGIVVRSKGEGDSFFAVFELPSAAVSAAVAIQSHLATTNWPPGVHVQVRIGINTGEATVRGDDYAGLAINRCARIRSLGKGGEVLLGSATAMLVRDRLPRDLTLIDRGERLLKGLKSPERIFELSYPTSFGGTGAAPNQAGSEQFLDAITELLESLTKVARPADLPKVTELIRALAETSRTQLPELRDMAAIQESANQPDALISTGFLDLDRVVGGFGRGHLVLIAGHPGTGKTSFALNVALHSSVMERVPVVVISLEAPKESVTERLIAIQAMVDIARLHRGVLSEHEFERISTALGPLGEAPLYIDDSPSLDLGGLAEKVRRSVSEHGARMIILDYPALMRVEGSFLSAGPDFEEAVAQSAKRLARETETVMVLISQADQSIRRADRRPLLREVGGHSHADCVLAIHLRNEAIQGSEIAEVIVAKNRRGPTGTIELLFRPQTGRFVNFEASPHTGR